MSFDRIRVTGGAGLIGGPTVRHLANLGAMVIVLERHHESVDVDALEGDVTPAFPAPESLTSLRRTPSTPWVPTPYSTAPRIAEFAKSSTRLASTQPASRLNDRPLLPQRYPFDESTTEGFTDAYSLSKKANEQAAAQIASRDITSITGLRFGSFAMSPSTGDSNSLSIWTP